MPSALATLNPACVGYTLLSSLSDESEQCGWAGGGEWGGSESESNEALLVTASASSF